MSSSATFATYTPYERRLPSLVLAYPNEFLPVPEIEYSSLEELEAYLRENVPLEARYLIAEIVENAFADIRANYVEYNEYANRLKAKTPSAKIKDGVVQVYDAVIARALRRQLPTLDPLIDYIIEYEYPAYILGRFEDEVTDEKYESPIETYFRIVDVYQTRAGLIPEIEVPSLGIIGTTIGLPYSLDDPNLGYIPPNINWTAGDSVEDIVYGGDEVPLPVSIIELLKREKVNNFKGNTYDRVVLVPPSLPYGGRSEELGENDTYYDLLEKTVASMKKIYEMDNKGKPEGYVSPLESAIFEGFSVAPGRNTLYYTPLFDLRQTGELDVAPISSGLLPYRLAT